MQTHYKSENEEENEEKEYQLKLCLVFTSISKCCLKLVIVKPIPIRHQQVFSCKKKQRSVDIKELLDYGDSRVFCVRILYYIRNDLSCLLRPNHLKPNNKC